jgi:uncharacterized membrane protein YjjP (DUF1212 family)
LTTRPATAAQTHAMSAHAAESSASPPADASTLAFVVELSVALSRAGEPVGRVQPRAARIAEAYGVPEARVVVLPNLALAAEGRGSPVELDTIGPSEADLRLDQMGAVERLARRAEYATVSPQDGLRTLQEITALPHRFGPVGIVAGHVIITLGLCLMLQPTPIALLASAIFGALVGLMKLGARNAPRMQVLLPVTAAALVSLLAFRIAPNHATQESLRALIPPLVTFLPGGLIATATLDLAAGHLISGSSRLVAGATQLLLLALGIAIGAQLAGVDIEVVAANTPLNTLGVWAPQLGAVVFGVGCYVHFSGAPRSLGWLVLVLLTAWVAEQLGSRLLSDQLGAFVGALVVRPVAAWVAARPSGPPSIATLVPAVWLLVPGALSLIGVAEFVGPDQLNGIGHFVDALLAFILIALGVYIGDTLLVSFRSRRSRAIHARSR